MHGRRGARAGIVIGVVASLLPVAFFPCRLNAAVTREEVERAIHDGVRFLTQAQRSDGSWADVHTDTKTGTTSLVTLALLTAGQKKGAGYSLRHWSSCATSDPTSSTAPTQSPSRPWFTRLPIRSATRCGSPRT